MTRTLVVSASTIESYVTAAESVSSQAYQDIWLQSKHTPDHPMDKEGSELWPTAELINDHS